MKIAHLDYEFRSGVSINDVGSHRASIDPKFEILCAAVMRDDDPAERVYLWVNPLFICPDMPGTDNAEAEKILAEADLVYAHNAPNEMANTWGALRQGKNCPFKTEPSHKIWRCTAAMARKAGMPNALEDLCDALGVADPKDRRGKALIKLFCEIDDSGDFVDPRSRPDDWAAFGNYACQDVRAETACGNKLKPFELTGASLDTFQFDLRMNQRGIPINVKAARYAQRIIDTVQGGVTAEFRKLTGLNPTQRDKFIKWMAANCGLELPNTQAATIDALITKLEKEVNDATIPVGTRAVLERQLHLLGLYQKVSYAAVKKIQTMLDCVCPDGRVRGAHMYYGAGTGRWSGKLLQPQNFKKTPKWMRDITDEVYRHICRGVPAEYLDRIYGDPLELISGCIRHFIHHDAEILDGDFNAVEARIICWLAGQDDILEKWRNNEDLYCWMASHVYGYPCNKKDHPDEREVGKRIILGCGFQMGWEKFQSSCRIQYQLELSDEICQKGVKLFRQLCKKITAYWYFLNDRAKEAVKTGGESGPFRMRTIGGIKFLLFKLRSGRSLAYPHPKIELVPYSPKKVYDEFGDEEPQEQQYRENITYWGQIPGSGQWGRIKLYGGKLAENETQATAADFMAYGAINAERLGMEPFMLVHDQGLALRTRGQSAQEFEEALGTLPPWARGFPLKVEAKVHPYYRK